MNLLLVGRGRMGRAVLAAAEARGHRVVAVVDPSASGRGLRRRLSDAVCRRAEVALEFTTPAAAPANVRRMLEVGLPVVCGTTGWAPDAAIRRAARRTGAVVAPNFSLGMGVFYRLVGEAARALGRIEGYDPWIEEIHHRGKSDAPSGTARRLASLVSEATPGEAPVVSGLPVEPVPHGAVHVSAVRAGHEPGLHRVGFDGEHDVVVLEHRARGRSGFAQGAVLAAEWIRGRRGLHGFEEVLDDLLGPRRSARGGVR